MRKLKKILCTWQVVMLAAAAVFVLAPMEAHAQDYSVTCTLYDTEGHPAELSGETNFELEAGDTISVSVATRDFGVTACNINVNYAGGYRPASGDISSNGTSTYNISYQALKSKFEEAGKTLPTKFGVSIDVGVIAVDYASYIYSTTVNINLTDKSEAAGSGSSSDGDDDSLLADAAEEESETKAPQNFFDTAKDEIKALAEAAAVQAKSGSSQSSSDSQTTVYLTREEGAALDKDIMTVLQNSPSVTLDYTYTYQGKEYHVVIPGGKSVIVDESIPWYGPLWLAAHYGVDSKSTTAAGNYTIQSGDSLSSIARRNNTTMANLLKLNPSITDANKIWAGVTIRIAE